MQTLPIGEQFFARLRKLNMLYVDKTEQIYNLMQARSYVFLSRPRRFSKSLLTTTLRDEKLITSTNHIFLRMPQVSLSVLIVLTDWQYRLLKAASKCLSYFIANP